jgi:predicted phage terminase large subunit-like protein
MEPSEEIKVENVNLKAIKAELESKYELYYTMLKEKAGKSLFHFNKFVLQAEKGDEAFVPLGSFHRELCNFVTDQQDRKKLILIPRSHLKSKLITIGYSTFRIIQNPKIRILIYSATWQMAVDLHMSIQNILKGNETIHLLWGNFSQGAREWSQDKTRLEVNDKREATITAAGVDNNLVGGHYDLIIMDDVVNRDNIGTADQIEKVLKKFRDSLDLLEPHGQLVVIGTRWHDADLYGWIQEKDNQVISDFDVLIKRAYEGDLMTGENFIPLWPGKFDQEGFRKLLRAEGWAHFSAQYMNDPVPEENATFKRQYIRYYESPDTRGKYLSKFLLIDPAISLKKEADYSAFIVLGVDEYNYLYILDIIRGHLSPSDIINTIFLLQERWQINDVGIEQVAFQKTLAYSLREDPRFRLRPFHITELKPNERSKDERIKGLQPLYEAGKVLHNRLLPNNIYLEDELIRFPNGRHDDLIDALSYATDIIYPAKQPASRSGGHKWLY